MHTLQYELYFGLGIILQLVFAIGSKFEKSDIWKILGSIAIGLFGTARIAAKANPAWSSEALLFSVIVISACCFGIFLKQKLLPEISELTLLCWNIIFWFIYTTRFGFWNYFTLVLIIPTYISLIAIFFKYELNTFFQAFLYAWFMTILSYVGIVYFKFQNILFYKNINITDTPFDMLFSGMAFLYIAVNIINILNFIPIPLSKHQTFSERIREIKDHANLLADRYSDRQYNPILSIIALIILASVLILNFFKHFVGETSLIALSIAVIPGTTSKLQDYINFKNTPVSIPEIN